MLAIDDDPVSTWWSDNGYSPHLLIIDMKATKSVSKIIGSGLYLNHLRFFVTDAEPFSGYVSYDVDWNSYSREDDYNSWVNSMTALIPEVLPQPSWGKGPEIAATTDEEDTGLLPSTFSFTTENPLTGRYLIILFRDSMYEKYYPGEFYAAISDLEVYD
jgi:hypothetical protein